MIAITSFILSAVRTAVLPQLSKILLTKLNSSSVTGATGDSADAPWFNSNGVFGITNTTLASGIVCDFIYSPVIPANIDTITVSLVT